MQRRGLYCPQDRAGTDVQAHRNATKAPLTGNRSTKPPPAARLGPSDSTSATPVDCNRRKSRGQPTVLKGKQSATYVGNQIKSNQMHFLVGRGNQCTHATHESSASRPDYVSRARTYQCACVCASHIRVFRNVCVRVSGWTGYYDPRNEQMDSCGIVAWKLALLWVVSIHVCTKLRDPDSAGRRCVSRRYVCRDV